MWLARIYEALRGDACQWRRKVLWTGLVLSLSLSHMETLCLRCFAGRFGSTNEECAAEVWVEKRLETHPGDTWATHTIQLTCPGGARQACGFKVSAQYERGSDKSG